MTTSHDARRPEWMPTEAFWRALGVHLEPWQRWISWFLDLPPEERARRLRLAAARPSSVRRQGP
jgi:hypothetical protein